jgi:hypothetical protein
MLYFLPNEPGTPTLKRIQALGLGYAFARAPAATQVTDGPSGCGGVVVAEPDRVPRIEFHRDQQRWQKLPGSEVWVGCERDQVVDPQRLRRVPQLVAGHWTLLADGQVWWIPVARSAHGGENVLPRQSTLDETGKWVAGGTLTRYAHLWEIASRWWDARVGAVPADTAATGEARVRMEMDFDGIHEAAAAVLASNYCLGPAEISLLGLFDEQTTVEILDAVIDWPTITAWLEKKRDEPPAAAG